MSVPTKYTNPDGSEVTIRVTEGYDMSRIGKGARIGGGVRIGRGTVIGAEVRIGERAIIDTGAIIGEAAAIGDGASIGAHARIGECAVIGARAVVRSATVLGEGARIAPDDAGIPLYMTSLPDSPRHYVITMTATNLAIGCQVHPWTAWEEFSDAMISVMDGAWAVDYWRKYKPLLFQIGAATVRAPAREPAK